MCLLSATNITKTKYRKTNLNLKRKVAQDMNTSEEEQT